MLKIFTFLLLFTGQITNILSEKNSFESSYKPAKTITIDNYKNDSLNVDNKQKTSKSKDVLKIAGSTVLLAGAIASLYLISKSCKSKSEKKPSFFLVKINSKQKQKIEELLETQGFNASILFQVWEKDRMSFLNPREQEPKKDFGYRISSGNKIFKIVMTDYHNTENKNLAEFYAKIYASTIHDVAHDLAKKYNIDHVFLTLPQVEGLSETIITDVLQHKIFIDAIKETGLHVIFLRDDYKEPSKNDCPKNSLNVELVFKPEFQVLPGDRGEVSLRDEQLAVWLQAYFNLYDKHR